MFVFVNTAHADLPDVWVDGVQLMSYNVHDVLGDGTVEYDEDHQTLILKNADITKGIVIDAYGLKGQFTINVTGNCIVTNEDDIAIWFKRGNGLTIAGTPEDHLTVKSLYNKGGSHHAIYCGSNEATWDDASMFSVYAGIDLYVDNYGSEGYYSAIGCEDFEIYKSKLVVSTHDDVWPFSTFSDAHVLDQVSFIDQKGDAYAYPFNEGYPVWIAGTQMGDGLPKDWSTGLPYISGFEMKAITSGSLSKIIYNPETRELILDGGVVLEAEYYHAIEIHNTADPSAAITIKRGPTFTYNPTEIISKNSGYCALHALTPVIVDANGSSIRFDAEHDNAMVVEDKLTLTNSDLRNESAELTIFGEGGSAVTSYFGNGELILDHVEMNIYGKGEVISNLANVEMKPGLNFEKPDDYEFAGGALVEKGTTNIVTYRQLFFVLSGWYFDAVAIPEGAGSFVFRNGADEVKPLPYLFTTDEQGSIEVTANAGWSFGKWNDWYGSDNPRDVYMWTSEKKSMLFEAQFSRNIESNETFYALGRYDRLIYPYVEHLRDLSYAKSALVPYVAENTYLDGAVSANGKLYAIEYDEVNGKSGLISFEFDGKEVTNAKGIVPLQQRYNPIRAIAFNKGDNKLYMVAYDTELYKDALLSINPESETAFTDLGELPVALDGNALAMAFDKSNDLYVFSSNAGVPTLYTLDLSSKTETNLGELTNVSMGYMYYDYLLSFSEATGELFLKASDDLFLVDPILVRADWISYAGYGSALFTGAQRYKVYAHPSAGQESWGYVSLTDGYNPAYLLPGEEIQAYAEAYSGYRFVKWADGETDNPRDWTVPEADTEFEAVFEEITKHLITVESNDLMLGTADIKYYGSPYGAYEGEELVLEAEPVSMFYAFVKWDDDNTDNPRTIVVGTEDKTYTAIFEILPTFTIEVGADPNGSAEIEGWGKSAVLPEGLEVNLMAKPVYGFVFDKWDEDGVTDNPRTIKVTGDATYTALFKAGVAHTITGKVDDEHKWYGNVLLPGGVTTAEYAEGTDVQLTVVIDKWYVGEYVFDHWADLLDTDPDYAANPRTITVGTSDATYEAVLMKLETGEVYLSVADGQDFWGKVAFEENGYSSYYGLVGNVVHAVATPTSDKYEFVKWNDDNTDNPRAITVTKDAQYFTATFAKKDAPKPKHTITVEVAAGDESKGDVNINGSGKSGEFEEGASITLNAIANTGYAFKEWNDGNTDEKRTVKVGTTDATYTASFIVDYTPKYTIKVEVAKGQEAMGDVDINGSGMAGDFAEGTKITLNAKPNFGYKFLQWNDGNTDKSRSFTVGKEDKTFIASFEEAPMPTGYPVTIADVTLTEEKSTLVAGVDLPGILKAGSITYDPTTNTLILNNVELEFTNPSHEILIDGGEANTKVNIEIVGNCKITATGVALHPMNSAMITLSGDGKLEIKSDAIGIYLDNANLTLDGIALTIDAVDYGIIGVSSAEKLIVNGSPISVKGANGSIKELGNMELYHCSFKSGYKFENNQVEKGGSLAIDAVILDVWPMLTVSPVDKGSANFTLKSKNTGESFTNKGWFEKDDEVTITATKADNFVFARWLDDPDWKDKDLRIKETRKITKSDKDETFTALFYFEPESSNDWFGVNNDEFIKFSLGDHAAKVARASNSLSDVKGGDYDGENWIFIEDATVNYFEFNGTLKDGEDILGKSGKIEKYNKKSISDVTDVTIDFMEGDIYAVAESKLYRVTSSENKEIATFKLDKVETIIYAIAVDANGTMYALGRNASKEALLFTVNISDKDANLKVVGKPENGGKVGGAVVDGAQALAFDLSTGELFWGAADYLRIIDTKKMQTFVVGDLGQKEGKQGTIKSLHCLTQMVEVGVTVAEGQESWGTATVGETSTTGKKNQYVSEDYLPGETVTITATAKEGYHFDHWEIEGDKKHTEYKPATLDIEAEEIVYVAYFAEGEGIESITIDPTKNVQKVLVDGVIYILRDGYIYTVTGEKVQ